MINPDLLIKGPKKARHRALAAATSGANAHSIHPRARRILRGGITKR
jgi:hypothetical protein